MISPKLTLIVKSPDSISLVSSVGLMTLSVIEGSVITNAKAAADPIKTSETNIITKFCSYKYSIPPIKNMQVVENTQTMVRHQKWLNTFGKNMRKKQKTMYEELIVQKEKPIYMSEYPFSCPLYTSDAADE